MNLPPTIRDHRARRAVWFGTWREMARQSLESARDTDCAHLRRAYLRVARRRARYARENYEQMMESRHG